MFKKALMVAAVLAMFGCSSTPDPSHPALPTPISPYTFHWKVLVQEDHVYVALTYDESLRLKVLMEDMTRYMRDSNAVMCFYRKDLNEYRCQEAPPTAASR
ncbi:hypothetical protein D3C76_882530 [compost metagenome]